MISLLVTILIFALVAGLIYYVLGLLPLPPVVRQIVLVVMAVICVIWMIEILLPLAGGGVGLRGLR